MGTSYRVRVDLAGSNMGHFSANRGEIDFLDERETPMSFRRNAIFSWPSNFFKTRPSSWVRDLKLFFRAINSNYVSPFVELRKTLPFRYDA